MGAYIFTLFIVMGAYQIYEANGNAVNGIWDRTGNGNGSKERECEM